MPLRSVKMKRFILGFQRRVWCPKWTPLSRSWRVVTTAMAVFLSLSAHTDADVRLLAPSHSAPLMPARRRPEGSGPRTPPRLRGRGERACEVSPGGVLEAVYTRPAGPFLPADAAGPRGGRAGGTGPAGTKATPGPGPADGVSPSDRCATPLR